MCRSIPALAAVCATLLLAGCSREKNLPPQTYAIGEKATVGHMVYTVFETRWEPQLPQQPTPRIPQNRFFLIRMSAMNGAGSDVILPDITLEDDAGNSFTPLSNGDGVPQWMGALRKISPAEAATGAVAFDVPPKHYKLRVSDENNERAAYIDLPLNFNSEAPVTPPVPNEAKQ